MLIMVMMIIISVTMQSPNGRVGALSWHDGPLKRSRLGVCTWSRHTNREDRQRFDNRIRTTVGSLGTWNSVVMRWVVAFQVGMDCDIFNMPMAHC